MKEWSYQPAQDLGVPPLESFKSPKREKGFFSHVAHMSAAAGFWTYFRLYHRLRVIGREKFPTAPPFVIVSNHSSHADAVALACALPAVARRHTYSVAAGDVFFANQATSALSALLINALPIWRKKVTTHAMEDLRERLLAGHTGLIIFPEGGRTRDGKPQRFKPGIGMLVAGTNVPVYPCHIAGSFRALPPGKKWPRPKRITVRVGDPVSFPDAPATREGWESVALALRERIGKLAPGNWDDPRPPSTPEPVPASAS